MKIKDFYYAKDDDDKVELINSLNFDEYQDKWELILEVIENSSEYDLARIEALKVIELATIPKLSLDKLCEIIFYLLKNEKDYDVRNYALIAARNLINKSVKIKDIVVEISLSKEDVDIKHNAYSAILRISNIYDRNKVLKLLLEDKVLSLFAKKDILNK